MKNIFQFILILGLFYLVGCSSEVENVQISNHDSENIDSLFIHLYSFTSSSENNSLNEARYMIGNSVPSRTFLIENLAPRETKHIRIDKLGEHYVILVADNGEPLDIGRFNISLRNDVGFRAIITKERVLSKGS